SAATSTPAAFDAGAASVQFIHRGDAYIEFSAGETTLSHVVGLSQVRADCTDPAACPDTVAGLADIQFALSLARTGEYGIFESGVPIPGPQPNGTCGNYSAGERFRITLHDNYDGTAAVTYSKLTAPCIPGAPCAEEPILERKGPAALYPLRVDASFREQGAIVTDVRIVRVQ